MRILQISTPFLPVRKDLRYGGIERIVYFLDKKLSEKSHKSFVMAPGKSKPAGQLIKTNKTHIGVPGIPPYNSLSQKQRGYLLYQHMSKSLSHAFKKSDNFDIIHAHTENIFPFLSLIKKPSLLTSHNSYAGFWVSKMYPKMSKIKSHMVAISKSQQKIFRSHGYNVRYMVHNAIDPNNFKFSENKKDYILTVGNISPGKKPHLAIQVAKKLGLDIVISGNIADRNYFENYIRPHVTHDLSKDRNKLKHLESKSNSARIIYAGMTTETEKKWLYANAKAFIMPISPQEPFGLVMIEAMASGTPVVAFNHGPAPEIVSHKKTGYLVDTVNQMVKAVESIEKIKPENCRNHVMKNFTIDNMTDNYLKVYQNIIDGYANK